MAAATKPEPRRRNAVAEHQPARARDLIVAIDQAIDDLTATRAAVTQATIRANRDSDAGLSAGSGGEHVTQSSIPDRATAEKALALVDRPDTIADNARKMVDAIGAARAMSQLALRSARFLLPLDHDRAEKFAREIEGGPAQCANCKCDVWRTAKDRLRSGRCNACFQYRLRHDGIDRPRELWEAHDARVQEGPKRAVSSG